MEIRKLQFGNALSDAKGGKDAKGAGKGKGKKSKKGIPVNPLAFRQEPEQVREGLASLSFARCPFNISVRPLESGDKVRDPQAMPVDQEGQPASKRQAEQQAEQKVKRRSPTPTRAGQRPHHQQAGWGTDPWANAAHTHHASNASHASRPPRPEGAQADMDGGGAAAVLPPDAGDRAAESARIEA